MFKQKKQLSRNGKNQHEERAKDSGSSGWEWGEHVRSLMVPQQPCFSQFQHHTSPPLR